MYVAWKNEAVLVSKMRLRIQVKSCVKLHFSLLNVNKTLINKLINFHIIFSFILGSFWFQICTI